MKKLIIICLISSTAIAQGPVDGFMKKKKEFSVGLSFSNEKANKLYAGTNSIDAGRTTRALSLFAIYGITDKLNVQVNVPYLNVNKGAEQNLQDGSLYLKYSFYKKTNKLGELQAMGALGFASPLADYQTSGGSAIGQASATGDARLVVQQGLKNNLFVSVQGGFFYKENPTPNAVSSSVKVGYAGKVYADVFYEIVHAFGGTNYQGIGDLAPNAATGGFRGLGFSNQKIGGTIFYGVRPHIGVFAGASYVLNGRNAFKNTGLNIGVVFQ